MVTWTKNPHGEKLQRYYVFGLGPLLILSLSTFLFIPFIALLYVWIGFLWPYCMAAPGIPERALSRRYKYSLVGITYKIHILLQGFVKEQNKNWMPRLLRSVPAIVFSLITIVTMREPYILSVLIGAVFFELWVVLQERRGWELMDPSVVAVVEIGPQDEPSPPE